MLPKFALPILLLGSAPFAHAVEIEFVNQSRSVSGYAYATDKSHDDSDSQQKSAPNSSPFSEWASAYVSVGASSAGGTGSQTSSITSVALIAEGSHSSNADVSDVVGFADANGSSIYHVEFQLAQSCGYTLSGLIEAFDNGSSSVMLSGAGGTIHEFYAYQTSQPFHEIGTLPAGAYTLEASTSGSSFAFPWSPSYSFGTYDLGFALETATGVIASGGAGAPKSSPNPFREKTRMVLPSGSTSVQIFDAAGRLVRTLMGRDFVEWDGDEEGGSPLPGGVYFLRIAGRPETGTKVLRLR
jgi:hypothetical protein